jgi:hypothetical protein
VAGKLGVVTASIRLAVEGFIKSRQIIQSESRAVKESVEGIGDSVGKTEKATTSAMGRMADAFERAQKSANDFANTPLGKIESGLKSVQGQVLAVSAVFGGIAAKGVASAQRTAQFTTNIELLAGSTQKANKILETTRKISNEFGIPFQDLAEGAQAFIPLAKTTGVEIQELLKTATRFQAYNPSKSFDEIKFSINEALSGDFVSIKDSLDLSKNQREELKKIFEEQGSQGVLDQINTILVDRGFNDDTLKKFGQSGANAFRVLGDSVNQAMSDAFMPFLTEVLVPLAKSVSEFFRNLRESNPDLLKAMGAFAVGVAGAGALVTALTGLISVYKTLQGVSAMTNGNLGKLGGLAGKLAVAGVAAEVGNRAGLGVVTGLANAGAQGGDFERIRKGEDAGAVVGERAKQLIVVLTDVVLQGIIDVISNVVKGFTVLVSVLDFVKAGFEFFGTFITEFVGNLQSFIGTLLVGLADNLSGLFDTTELRNSGKANQAMGAENTSSAQTRREELGTRLQKGVVIDTSGIDTFLNDLSKSKTDMVQGLTEMLFPIEEVATVTEDVATVVEKAVTKIGDSDEYLAEQAQEIADATTSYNDDVKKINSDYEQNRLKEIEKYNDNIVKIAQDAASDSAKALQDMIDDREKIRTDMQRDEAKSERDFSYDLLDAQIEAQRDEAKTTQAHADKLVKIRADAQKKEQGLLQDMDFAGLFELRSQTKDSLDEASDEFAKQRQERNTALSYELQDLQTAFGRERMERQIKFQDDLTDRSIQYHKELEQNEANRVAKLAQAQTEHQQTLQALTTKHQQELALRQQSYREELSLLMMTEAERKKVMMQTQQDLINQAYQLMQRKPPMPAAPPRDQSPAPRPRPVNSDSGGGAPQRAPAPKRVMTFATGGNPPVGEWSVVNEGFRGQMENFVRNNQAMALPGGAGLFMPFSNGSIEPNTGGTSKNVTININGAQDPMRIKQEVLNALKQVMA